MELRLKLQQDIEERFLKFCKLRHIKNYDEAAEDLIAFMLCFLNL